MSDRVVETDILVIGGGGAGCIAALEAARRGADVLIVSKDLLGHGNTMIAGGGFSAPFGHMEQGDDLNTHFKDTIESGEFINNQELAWILVREAKRTALQLEREGLIFKRIPGKGDKYYAYKLGGHGYARVLKPGLGIEYGMVMKEAILKLGIEHMDEVMVTELLETDGTVVGAMGVDIEKGVFLIFRANCVILATGGLGEIFAHTTNVKFSTGDGYSMAYRAGAELVDMEMIQFIPLGLTHPPALLGRHVGEPGYAGPHGKLLNAKGERIMEKYDPIRMEYTTRAIMSRAIAIEVKEGRGTEHGGCLLDLTENKKYSDGQRHLEEMRRHQWHGLEIIRSVYGERAAEFDEPWDVYPTQHYTMGGVKINEWGETKVPSLYAVGEASGGIHGANRLGGNSLCEVFVFGRRVGRRAAKRAKSMGRLLAVDMEKVEGERERVYNILDREEGVHPSEIRGELRKTIWDYVGVLRNGEGLGYALNRILELQDKLSLLQTTSKSTRYNMEWIEALETYNMVNAAEMVTRAALIRTETRGGHCREDYQQMDNKNWLKNIVINLEDGRMNVDVRSTLLTRLRP